MTKDIVSMCRYASPDQPRPRRCTELRSPCDQCAAAEQAKMDELGEEHMKCNQTRDDLTLLDPTRKDLS